MSTAIPRLATTRRAVLRGMGAALALPWLESFPLAADEPARPAQPPRRLVATSFANGVMPDAWWAKGAGEAMELGFSLEPLAPLKRQLLLVEGLRHAQCIQQVADPHYSREPAIFCGVRPRNDTADLRMATTFDQEIARVTGRATPLASLVLSAEDGKTTALGGYSPIYGACAAWSSPSSPVPPLHDPRAAFARVFADNARRRVDASILDAVRADAARVMRALGGEDRQRLQEYEDSVRALEQRIRRAEAGRDPAAWQPPAADPAALPPPIGAKDLVERWDLLLDVAVLALRLDRTRVVNFQFEHCRSDISFEPFIKEAGNYHGLSHDGTRRAQQWREVVRLHMAALARFAAKLAACREGDASLLDRTMVACACGLRSGAHDAKSLPVLVLGGAAAGIRTGRAIDATAAPRRELNGLWLALMHRMGVAAERFNDAEVPFEDIA